MFTIAQALKLGLEYQQAGQLPQAEQLYLQILQTDPQQINALYQLGAVASRLGRYDLAVDYIRQVIRRLPRFAEAHNNLGNALKEQGKLPEAQASYEEAVRLQPNYAAAHNNLGNVFREQGKLEEAVASLQQALRLQPDFVDAANNLGLALVAQGELGEAVACLEQALHLQPNHAKAHNNLGIALKEQGRFEEAIACWQQALRCQPDFAEAANNLGLALVGLGRLEEAVASLQQALQLQPDYALAHNNLGIARKQQGKWTEAIACLNQALHFQPEYAEARYNLGLLWLLLGNLEQGWPAYERRWQLKGFVIRVLPQKRWDGSPLGGQTILLYPEQGLGDTLQFIRYASLVQHRGGRVVVPCPAVLRRLLATCPGIDQLTPLEEPLPLFDVQAPLLSLPGIFGTELATIPATVPYLHADPELAGRWRSELNQGPAFRIGIVWQGNPAHTGDRQRSLPLAAFARFARVPGVQLYSLQKGPGSEQLAAQTGRFPIIPLGERFTDLADTAAVVVNLDLIMSVDTSVAHLAGALGKPVWVALPHVPDWRWLLDREDSPWYPTLRLFRQGRWGDWDEVLAGMEAALRQHVEAVKR